VASRSSEVNCTKNYTLLYLLPLLLLLQLQEKTVNQILTFKWLQKSIYILIMLSVDNCKKLCKFILFFHKLLH